MYIYKADVWCDSCGEKICAVLRAAHVHDSGYDNGDSDTFPQYQSHAGESDTPQHCGSGADCLEAETLPSGRKIGALLGTDLTSDGVDYVVEAVRDAGEVAEYWREQFCWIDFPAIGD